MYRLWLVNLVAVLREQELPEKKNEDESNQAPDGFADIFAAT